MPEKESTSLLDLGRSSKFAIVFFLSFVLAKLLGIAFSKIFTNTLTENEMGTYSIITSAIMLVIAFSSFGFTGSLNRYIIKYKTSRQINKIKDFVTTGVLLYILAEVVVVCCLYVVYFITRKKPWFLQVSNYVITLLLVALIVLSQVFSVVVYVSAISVQNGKYYSIVVIMRVLLQIPFGILFVIFFDLGLFGLILGLATSEISVALYSIYILIRDIGIGRFSLVELKKISTYSLPSYYVGNLWKGFDLLIFFLVEFFYPVDSSEIVALYRYGALVVANLILIAGNVFSLVYKPVVFRLFEQKRFERMQRVTKKILKLFLVTIIPISIGLYAYSPILIVIFTNAFYRQSIFVIPIILGTIIMQYLQGIIGYGHSLYLKQYWNAIAATIAFICGTLAGYFIIPINGLVGLVLALFVIRFVYSFGLIIVSQFYLKLKYDVKSLLLILGSTIISIGIGIILNKLVFSYIAIYSITISFTISILIFLVLILVTKQITKDDLKFFRKMFQSYIDKIKRKDKKKTKLENDEETKLKDIQED